MTKENIVSYLIYISFLISVIIGTDPPETPHSSCPDLCVCQWDKFAVECTGISEIPKFTSPKSVKTLYLDQGNIPTLNETSFSEFVNLERLYVTNCSVTQVSPGSFSQLKKIEAIDLRYNELKFLMPGVFSDLHSLSSLWLSNNHLHVFSLGSFKNLTNLQALFLSNNEIKALSKVAFQSLPSVNWLDLGYNDIRLFPKEVFAKLPGLKTLHMNDNHLTALHENDFINCGNVTTLDLQNNDIESIDIKGLNTDENSETGSEALKSLTLTTNKLVTVPPALSKLPFLLRLDLSGNHFLTLSSDDFGTGMGNLKSLKLSNVTELTEIKSGAFQNLKSLRSIDISSNKQLTTIPDDIFHPLTELRYVFLSYNNIKTFKEDLLNWKALGVVDIRHNPINCTCDMQWLSQADAWKIGHNLTSKLVCASPENVANKTVAGLKSTYTHCNKQKEFDHHVSSRLVTAAVVSTIVFICFVFIALFVKYRRTLMIRWRYYRYARQNDDSLFTVNNDFNDFPSGKEELRMSDAADG